MGPIYMARGLADGRHKELLAEAERHRLIAPDLRASGPLAI